MCRKRTGRTAERTFPARAAARTREFIEALGGQPSAAAGEALESLLADPTLADWKRTLGLARDRQQIARRDSAYEHPTGESVAETLRGGLPGSAADLLALVADHLDDFAAELRDGDENAWRGFWSEDSYGRPDHPKPENSCRDVLMGALRARLHDRITVLAEVRHAANTRADLRVSCNGLTVPMEIKREGHPGLWTAVSEQLVSKYTNLPAADGYGIYLVLWFGRHQIPKGPSGQAPTSPGELVQALEGTVPRDSASRIAVRVLDVTRPPGSATARPAGRKRIEASESAVLPEHDDKPDGACSTRVGSSGERRHFSQPRCGDSGPLSGRDEKEGPRLGPDRSSLWWGGVPSGEHRSIRRSTAEAPVDMRGRRRDSVVNGIRKADRSGI